MKVKNRCMTCNKQTDVEMIKVTPTINIGICNDCKKIIGRWEKMKEELG